MTFTQVVKETREGDRYKMDGIFLNTENISGARALARQRSTIAKEIW